MAFLARTLSLFRNLFRGSRVERELDAELLAHIDLVATEKMAAGMSPEEARRSARLEIGAEQVKEQVRDVRMGALIEQLVADLRYGLRLMGRNPGSTAVAVLTLGLGIGATTAIFSVVYGVLLRPLPYFKPGQIVELSEVDAQGNRMSFADPNFEDVRAQNHSLAGMAEYAWWLTTVTGGSEPTRTLVAVVSCDFFPVMQVRPTLGRSFAPHDQQFGAAPVALVSDRYWKQYLGGTADLSQLHLIVENQSTAVVGVLPPGFRFPGDSDIWAPRELMERLPSRTAHNFHVVARLRDDVSLTPARAELSAIAARLAQEHGRDSQMADVAAIPLQEYLTGRARPSLLVLLGAVGLLLLIACANVVSLSLTQAAARARELAIRSALGAERLRLVRQFLAEALLLAMTGGALGVLTAMWGVHALLAIAPRDLPRLEDVGVNAPVLLFGLGVSVLVAAVLGILTGLRASSAELQHPLAEGARGEAGRVGAERVGRFMVAAQLAITLVLLVGAGLLGRSLAQVLSVDPGFRTDDIVTVDLAFPPADSPAGAQRRVQFVNDLFASLRRLPDVKDVGATNALPLASDVADGTYVLMNPQERVPGSIPDLEALFQDSSRTGHADYSVTSEGYFRALSIPLLRGRLFDDRDTMDAPHVAVVSESLAREKFAGQEPLGRSIEFGNMDGDLRLLTIVGVVGDVRHQSLEVPPRPTIYVNYRQRPQAAARLVVVMRAGAAPAALLPAAREFVRTLDPNVSPDFSTFSRVFSRSLETRRFNLVLITAFACTALLLAMAGIYGVMAYSVARRTREIGVRMALGATAGTVLRQVLSRGMVSIAMGMALGIAGSFALTRTMQSLLFGVSTSDPLTFAGVALLLVLVALLASYLPARRATRVDPMVVLRYE